MIPLKRTTAPPSTLEGHAMMVFLRLSTRRFLPHKILPLTILLPRK
jgi:hypothetical protein